MLLPRLLCDAPASHEPPFAVSSAALLRTIATAVAAAVAGAAGVGAARCVRPYPLWGLASGPALFQYFLFVPGIPAGVFCGLPPGGGTSGASLPPGHGVPPVFANGEKREKMRNPQSLPTVRKKRKYETPSLCLR